MGTNLLWKASIFISNFPPRSQYPFNNFDMALANEGRSNYLSQQHGTRYFYCSRYSRCKHITETPIVNIDNGQHFRFTVMIAYRASAWRKQDENLKYLLVYPLYPAHQRFFGTLMKLSIRFPSPFCTFVRHSQWWYLRANSGFRRGKKFAAKFLRSLPSGVEKTMGTRLRLL